jgi:single-strand DNA-binding protein
MGLNRTILTGRLTADPDVRYTTNEIPVTRFSLAVNRPSRNGAQDVDFINVVAWRGLAKVCGEYLKKGRLIAVEGRLQIRKYEKDGQKRTFAEIVANNMQMLDNKFYQKASSAAQAEDEGKEELAIAEPAKKGKKK